MLKTVRVTAFGISAALVGPGYGALIFDLRIADGIQSSVGFFGLLYSAYALVLDL